MRERLERIQQNDLLRAINDISLYGPKGIRMEAVIKDIEWLIQQAERVEELEEENDELAEHVHKLALDWSELVDERNRYKQALELIYKDTFYESEHDLVSPIHVIRKRAEKALEGDK